MSDVEDSSSKRIVPDQVRWARLTLLGACLLWFSIGYAIKIILSLPLPAPENTAELFLLLVRAEFFSSQTMVLLGVAIHSGRHFDSLSQPQGKFLEFPSWLLKQPFAGIFLGLTIFVSPVLISIGPSGIVYLLFSGLVLYSTPRLLAQGLVGAVALMAAWALAGFFLAVLMLSVPRVEDCNGDALMYSHSGTSIPCEDFVFLENARGLIVRSGSSSRFLPMSALVPSTLKTLGPGPWLAHEFVPID